MKRNLLGVLLLVFPVLLWAGGGSEKGSSDVGIEAADSREAERTLIDMAEAGDISEIEKTLKLDINLNAADDEGRTALHAAAENGDAQIAAILLVTGAEIDPVDDKGQTPLFIALSRGHSEVLKVLAGEGADPTVEDENGQSAAALALEKNPALLQALLTEASIDQPLIGNDTMLHAAARDGLENYVTELLTLGASPAVRNPSGESPIDAALAGVVSSRHAACAALLLENGSPRPESGEWRYITEPLRTGDFTVRFDYGSTVLHLAAERGHEGMLRYLISRGADVNLRDQPGNTALHVAVRRGYRTIASILVDNGTDINARDYNGNAPIHESLTASDGNAMTAMLLDRGADANAKNGAGSTPLHLAVLLSADVASGRLLLDRGAQVDPRDRNGNTPLLLAVDTENRPLAELFLSEGAAIYARNNQGITPAVAALRNGADTVTWFFLGNRLSDSDDEGRIVLHHALLLPVEISSLQILLESGANPNTRDFNGETAVHYAVRSELINRAKAMIEMGGDIFLENNSGRSPLILAFDHGGDRSLELLENDIDPEDAWGNTPLYHAVQWDYTDIVGALLSAGADPKHQNHQGATALHEAVRADNIPAAQMLFAAGADLNAGDSMGRTSLHDAVTWGSFEMVRLLVNNGAATDVKDRGGQTPLHMAAFAGNDGICEWLLNAGASPNVRDNDGRTPLFIAAENGREETIALFVSGGVNLSSRDNEGRTALHTALLAESESSAAALIEFGADIFAMDAAGTTPFDIALEAGVSLAEALMSPRVVNLQDNMGNAPLHLSVIAGADSQVIRLLLESGADKEARNARGETAYDLATKLGNDALAAILY